MKKKQKKTAGQIAQELKQQPFHMVRAVDLAAEQQANHIDELKKCIAHAQKKLDQFDCAQMPCQPGCQDHPVKVSNCYALSCADYCKARDSYLGDLYIEYQVKHEEILNVYSHKFIWHIACPTPNYDQSVFKYHAKDERLEYLWTVPDRVTCLYLLENSKSLPPSEHQLLDFVIKFADGTLFKVMKLLNNEQMDSPLLNKKIMSPIIA